MPAPLNINIGQKVMTLVSREVGANRKYTTKDCLQSTVAHGLKSFDAYTCTMVNFNTEQKINKMWHLAPEYEVHQNFNYLLKFFKEEALKLQDQFGKIRAFIYGGVEMGSAKHNKDSFNLYNNLADAMENLNIDFAMLCGKKGFKTPDNMHVIDNRLTIWNDKFKELGKNPEKLDKSQKLEFLTDNYQFVESAGDDFFTIL